MFKIKEEKFDEFSILGVKSGKYENSGVAVQQKVPKVFHFRSLEESMKNPVLPEDYSMLLSDYAKIGRTEELHFAVLGLWEFQVEKKCSGCR